METLRHLWRRIDAFAAHADPQVQAANWIALVVAWNQPFYPLYLWEIVDAGRLGPSLLTFLSTPFFALIPAISRRRPRLSRAMLPVAGIANTAISAKAFGEASGVEIFLIPCALIAASLFTPRERILGIGLAVLALLVFLGLHGRYGTPLCAFSGPEYAAMLRLNAVSAGTLTVFVGLLLAGNTARAPLERLSSLRRNSG